MIFSILIALVFWAGAAQAAPVCVDVQFSQRSYTVCRVDVVENELRLFLKRADGGPHASFASVDKHLQSEGGQLSFAMNAGMYHADRSPVGLYVEKGEEVQRLVTSAGPGNFGLLPNGVFCIREKRVDVFETLAFGAAKPKCTYASQSGPMLVIDGALHPRFLADGTSRYVRNGVGVRKDGREAVFVISNERVTFHEFGTFFRDYLRTANALYFDGNISRLHAPLTGRSDSGFAMGPIVGVVDGKSR